MRLQKSMNTQKNSDTLKNIKPKENVTGLIKDVSKEHFVL